MIAGHDRWLKDTVGHLVMCHPSRKEPGMPVGLIEIRRPTSAEEDDALIAAVHESLVAAFAIPRGDRHHRLVTHDPSRMVRGTGDQVADNYTRITIDCFVGRSINAKRTLYREIITRLATLGIDPLDVSILLRESPLENWGIRGGQAASDVDLGFTVTI